MKKMKIGKTGFEVSRVSMGTLAIGGESVWGDSDDEQSIRTIHSARDLGINFFDTAPVYGFGRSERVLGKALGAERSGFIVSSKCGLVWDLAEGPILYSRDGYDVRRNTTAKNIKREIDISLKRLNTDYIDIYYTHWQAIEEFPVPIAETMGALMDLKKEGKIRAIGASNVSGDQIREYLKYGRIDIIQNRFSMLDQMSFRELNPLLLENDITFHAYSPFERGLLTGAVDMNFVVKPADARSAIKWYETSRRREVLDMLDGWKPLCEKYACTLAGLAVAWLIHQGPNINVDAGSRRVKAIEENARGGEITLEEADIAAMTKKIDFLVDKYADEAKMPR
ncbi:MAG: aldo/keto reductase [Spirochaetales bacterium]|jgi:methylglyoxal reductase|nr:aldo/keto reductase [Spirochaetales bacterium]